VQDSQPQVYSILPTTTSEIGLPVEFLEYDESHGNTSLGRLVFEDKMMTEGWDYFEIEMFNKSTPEELSYTAGLAEGFWTGEKIYNAWRNTMAGFCGWQGEEFCNKLRVFLRDNKIWMEEMILSQSLTDPYWYHVHLVNLQMTGVIQGFAKYREVHNITGPTDEDILWMNLAGDLEDLGDALKANFTPQQVRGDGHCSALIKLLPGNKDLYVSHVTWNSLESMLRFQKKYVFPFYQSPADPTVTVPGHTTTFSSYPGVIASADDYYLLSSGLLAMETTIGNSNPELWKDVKAAGELQEWIRVLVANRLATNGESWTKIFSQFNSGTYNNQWMVVDYNKFETGKVLQAGTLWVAEQIPGLIVKDDLTHVLQDQQYWPSYNAPYFPEVYNESGIPALVKKYGDWFSYDKTPRAQIFRRDHTKVKDMGSMVALMRYNDFPNDPLSKCDCDPPFSGENGISCRSDLNPANGTYPFGALGHRDHAGTDMKVTSSGLFKANRFLAQAGPTHTHLPVFQWSKSPFVNTSHFGHPDIFNFTVVEHEWKL